jgi:branched-subunit amino acid aminotransferase/4-amino-4-deoxychorismate lyase
LGGITREVALECAGARGISIQEATFARDRLERAAEVFMTGTTIQIAAVVSVGETKIGGGRPGPIARMLLEDYLSKVREETRSPAHGMRG